MLNGFVIARRRVNAGGGPGPVSGVCVDWYVRVCGARVDCAWRGGVGFDVPAVRLALFEQFGFFCKFASLQAGRSKPAAIDSASYVRPSRSLGLT